MGGLCLAAGARRRGIRAAAHQLALAILVAARPATCTGRDWIVRALANPRGASGKTIALAQIILGNINSDLGDYAAARAAYEASIATSRDIGDTPWVAWAMHNLGIVTGYQGDYQRARELIEESLALDENTPNPERRHGLALSMLGDLAYCEGDYGRSRELLEQNLDISQRLGNDTSVAYDSYFLGRTLWQFDRAAARALIEQSLDHFRSTGDKMGTAYTAIELGRQAIEDGDLDRARALYDEAASLWRELGSAHVAVMCIEGFALLAVAADAWQEAARLLGAATSGRSTLGRPRPANERVSLEEAAKRVRSALDDADWDQWAESGARMRIEELVGEFLRDS